MIEGVRVLDLVTHNDQRGFFREIMRSDDEFFAEGVAQFSHSWMFTGVVKAWHLHHRQTDWWYVCSGVVRVGLCDLREGSPSRGRTMDLLMGDQQPAVALKVPPGVAHGCKALQGPANLFYLTSHTFDPDDVVKMPPDDPGIDFDWGLGGTGH